MTGDDRTYARVLRIGGVCLAAAGVCYLVSSVLSLVIGPAPGATELYLKGLAGHLVASQVNFGVWVLADVLLLPAARALYVALRPIARKAALVGSVLLAVFGVLDLFVTEIDSLILTGIATHYAAATTAAQRVLLVAAAARPLAVLPAATFFSYLISSIGLLIVSIVMLMGVFRRPTAVLGIVAAIEGLVGGLYMVVPALAVLLVPSLITFGLWALLSGWRLYQHGSAPSTR